MKSKIEKKIDNMFDKILNVILIFGFIILLPIIIISPLLRLMLKICLIPLIVLIILAFFYPVITSIIGNIVILYIVGLILYLFSIKSNE